jgi:hypothetical protein
MAFTKFQYETTISAVEMNDNFYHVAQGDLLPRGGDNLDTTSGAYDLGEDGNRWANIYGNTLQLYNDFQYTDNLLSETTLSGTSATINVSINLEPNTWYTIVLDLQGYETSTAMLYFNDDKTSVYGEQSFILSHASNTATASSIRNSAISGIEVGQFGYGMSYTSYSKAIITLYTGDLKLLYLERVSSMSITKKYVHEGHMSGAVWNDSNTITSILLEGGFDPGTNVQIWSIIE